MKVYKPVVLSISTLQIMALVVMTPVISKISSEFPDANAGLIKMMVTLPSVCMLFVSQLSGWLASFFSKKKLVLIGVTLYFAGGLSTYFTADIYQMIISRFVLGIGLGFFMPMTTGLVADFYTGIERTRTIGYSQAINYFFGVVATLMAGYVAMYNWRNVFLVYLFSAIVFIVIAIGLPEQAKTGNAKPRYYKLPKSVYFLGVCAALQMIVFYSCVTNIQVRLKEIGINNTLVSSIGISVLYLSCFIMGTILTKTLSIFKDKTVFIAITLTAAGYLLIGITNSEMLYFAGMVLVGIADGTLIPYIYSSAARHSPPEANGQTMATIICFISIGQFLAPLVFQAIIGLLGRNTISGGFLGMFGLIMVVAIAALALLLKQRKQNMEING